MPDIMSVLFWRVIRVYKYGSTENIAIFEFLYATIFACVLFPFIFIVLSASHDMP